MYRLSQAVALASGYLAIPMMISICADALLRGVLRIAIIGVSEANSFLLVTMILFGFAGAQANRQNFKMSIAEGIFCLPVIRWMRAFIFLCGGVALSCICYFTFELLWESVVRWEVTYGLVQVPVWPANLAVFIGMFLLLLQYWLDVVIYVIFKAEPF